MMAKPEKRNIPALRGNELETFKAIAREKKIKVSKFILQIGRTYDRDVEERWKNITSIYTTEVNIAMNLIGYSMTQFMKEAGIPCELPISHQAFLDKAKQIDDKMLDYIRNLMERYNGGWHLEYEYEPKKRIVAHKAHFNIKNNDRIPDEYKNGKKCFSLPHDTPETEALYVISSMSFHRASVNSVSLDIKILYEVARVLDASPRWVFGYQHDGNWFGLSSAIEQLYDCWSIQTEKGRRLIETMMDNILKGVGN